MKLSIIIAVYESYEIVRRQLRYFEKMNLPDMVEIIFVDDGSIPQIECDTTLDNFRLLETKDYRHWTQGLARMKGAEAARGEYLFMTDIDHILSRSAIDAALGYTGDKMVHQRRFAILDTDGHLVRDRETLLNWGLLEAAIRDSELTDGVHGNTWVIRKSVWEEMGGYNLKRCNSGTHLQGEDREFNKRWAVMQRAGKYQEQVLGPPIYFFPIGRYHATGDENPHGLFHGMRKEKWGDAD